MDVTEENVNVVSNENCHTTNVEETRSSDTISLDCVILDSSLMEEEQVVDLTCDNTMSSFVDLSMSSFVDLAMSPIVILDEGPKRRQRRRHQESYELSSDEEVVSVDFPFKSIALHSAEDPCSSVRSTLGTISCPICMDSYEEIVHDRRTFVSSQCGHLFCNTCIQESLAKSPTCPTCRKKLTGQQYHPIYI